MEYMLGVYDVVVVGGGHAGIEATLASSRLGCKTIMITMSLDQIANMPCNPSIGGTAKGHLVREIDALGGEMGRAADATMLQSRILNKGKGPAVHSLRAQIDRSQYHIYMKHLLERENNLHIKQDEIVKINVKNNCVESVVTRLGAVIKTKSVIICCGTYLNGKIFVGGASYFGGPDGLPSSNSLSLCLKDLDISLRRFKTGTPPRVNRRSIDFEKLEVQKGDSNIIPFSFRTKSKLENKIDCYIAYTNEHTHKMIRDNLSLSPLYGGKIEGVGPRYCPSIEDKIVRFSDKPRHQLFIEPLGVETEEIYLQGLSSSLPEDVQIAFLRTIKGLENVEVTRSAYAIEYDCCDPMSLYPTLECKKIPGLYGAGQFNGTSGYEEAAAQGLVAGINAALKVKNRPSFVLDRASSYIGTLIDDLVTKGCMDPYRMMTSRSEYRLLLRQDNADKRLTLLGHEIGLIDDEQYEKFRLKWRKIEQEKERLKKVSIKPSKELNDELENSGTTAILQPQKLSELIKRPQLSYGFLEKYDKKRPELSYEIKEQVEISLKYEGYIKKQQQKVEAMRKLESKTLPQNIDYQQIDGLRLEAREKLNKVKPINLGQAARISGVNPADITVLSIWLKQRGENK